MSFAARSVKSGDTEHWTHWPLLIGPSCTPDAVRALYHLQRRGACRRRVLSLDDADTAWRLVSVDDATIEVDISLIDAAHIR